MSPAAFIRRLRGSVRSRAFEREMEAEMQHHLELDVEQLIARGVPPATARLEARQRFGSVAFVQDGCRDSWGLRAIDAVGQDVRYALRALARYPGYTAVVLLTLALGIGANTAIFSVVYAVLVRPLPFANGSRLVEVRQRAATLGVDNVRLSPQELADYRARTPSLDAIVEYHQMSFSLLGRGEASRVQTGVVSTDFFDVLGVTPILGRTFRSSDDGTRAPAVLILSNNYWRRHFGGDPHIVGATFEMNDRVHTVVGVLPPIPQFPEENDVYMPPSACPIRSSRRVQDARDARMLSAIGRLRSDATIDRVQADLAAVTLQLNAEHPEEYDAVRTGFRADALSVQNELTSNARPTLLVLLAATGFVLLLVCANVANLTLARALGRERELAVRSALGADRGRIARQLLTESALLAVAGGLLGLLCGWLVRDLLVAFTVRFTPRADEIAIDAPVLAFTLGVSVLTGIVFGLAPAFSRRFAVDALTGGHRETVKGHVRARQLLIAAQVAISFVLLAGAGLLVRSVLKLQQVDGGFTTDRVLTMQISLDFVKYNTAAKQQAYYQAVLDKMSAEPGLQSAAIANTLPLTEAQPSLSGFTVEGQTDAERPRRPQADFKLASPAYFQTIGMKMLGGRAFTANDVAEAPGVAIVNASMAHHAFPDGDPVGRRVSLDNGLTWLTIVGLVNDVREYGLNTDPTDEVYLPVAQRRLLEGTLIVRAVDDPMALAERVPALVHEVDPRQPVSQIRTLAAIRSRSLAPPRLTAILVMLFAVVALVITAVGIVGVVAFLVSQRTTEIGVRMALGAPRASVVAMVVRQGLQPVAAGLAVGIAGALMMTRVMARLLFGIAPTDAVTYAAVVAVLAIVAACACLAPAKRAAAIDPMRALRMD